MMTEMQRKKKSLKRREESWKLMTKNDFLFEYAGNKTDLDEELKKGDDKIIVFENHFSQSLKISINGEQ